MGTFALMNIQENISLLPYNTFGIDKKAKYFGQAASENDILSALLETKKLKLPLIVLGGGSNILLTKDLKAIVLKIELKGIKVIEENEDNILVEVGAGENWHNFVLHCIGKGWAGVENLSLIPGTVGASPMQNIGAYGVEIKEVFQQLTAIHRESLEEKIFDWNECRFGYRESVFKNELKDQFIICRVVFKLSKRPVFHTEYGAITETLEKMGTTVLNIKHISDAVIQIRQSKLPDPKIIGNAGSFFKNPTLSLSTYALLKQDYPTIPGFPNKEGIKVPAAWLIEQTGWKGKTFGKIGVHIKQPLVLVNYGGGEGEDIKLLSQRIQESIKAKFGIELHHEVNIF